MHRGPGGLRLRLGLHRAPVGDLALRGRDREAEQGDDRAAGPRALPFGDKTGAALARYLRTRARDRQAGRPELWLTENSRGPLLAGSIKQMLKRSPGRAS